MDRYTKRIKLSAGILATIARIDEFKGLWQGGMTFNPQILKRLRASVIITSTGASTRIEGASLDDAEVARLLRGLHAKHPQGRDEEEIAGYADLLGRIFDNYKTLKLTEGNVLQFHAILLTYSKKDQRHKGTYKSSDNVVAMKNERGEQIILFRPTPPYLVKKEMDDVLEWTNHELKNGELHPLLVTGNFIFEFLAIHPFSDGNGRLSRALHNLLLLKAGYAYVPYVSLEEIIEERRADYYLSLRKAQKNHKTNNEDISPWLNFILDALFEQVARARKLMDESHPETILSKRQLEVFAVFDEDSTLGVADIDGRLKGRVPAVTIKQALSRLVAEKFVERLGQGRATRYRKRK